MTVLNNLCKVTWLEVSHSSANPEATEDFFYLLWPLFCLWPLQTLSFGKISLQVPPCSSLCLAVPCRMSFSIWLWGVEREAIFRVHKADLMESFTKWHFPLVHFPGNPGKDALWYHMYFWQNILHVNSLFSRKMIWVLQKAWCERDTGMSCLDGTIFLGLG